MKEKIRVAIVFGGKSTEHEISLLSAQNVINALDKSKFEPFLIGIDKQGHWHYNEQSLDLLDRNDASKIRMASIDRPVMLLQKKGEAALVSADNGHDIGTLDVLFPVLHGTYGEDGSVQGFAKLANIACVGCDILSSAVAMDKDIMKRIMRDAGLPVAPWLLQRAGARRITYAEASESLGPELFIKPANLGSSVGVSFVSSEIDFDAALEEALKYDAKVLIERKIKGREIECAVLGNENPEASLPGEVIPKDSFYSFTNKYIDENGAVLRIPAELGEDQIKRIQELSIESFRLIGCKGMARVDVFLRDDDSLVLNEINTIPGFTDISMYPKLWEVSGLTQMNLISRLIELAIEEHRRTESLVH